MALKISSSNIKDINYGKLNILKVMKNKVIVYEKPYEVKYEKISSDVWKVKTRPGYTYRVTVRKKSERGICMIGTQPEEVDIGVFTLASNTCDFTAKTNDSYISTLSLEDITNITEIGRGGINP